MSRTLFSNVCISWCNLRLMLHINGWLIPLSMHDTHCPHYGTTKWRSSLLVTSYECLISVPQGRRFINNKTETRGLVAITSTPLSLLFWDFHKNINRKVGCLPAFFLKFCYIQISYTQQCRLWIFPHIFWIDLASARSWIKISGFNFNLL